MEKYNRMELLDPSLREDVVLPTLEYEAVQHVFHFDYTLFDK